MPLRDLIDKRFGIKTRAVECPENSEVGTSAALLLKNNPNRLSFLVINLSANVIYLGLTGGVASSRGIRLNANGGMASMIFDEDFDAVGWAWYAIASGSNSAVYFLELLEY